MSFAQFVQMGLERVVRQFPPTRLSPDDWHPPAPVDMGALLTAEELWESLCHSEE